MNRVCILGIGLVTASGPTLEATWSSLISGASSVAPLPFGDLNGHVIATESTVDRLGDLSLAACDQVFARLDGISVDALCIGSSSAGFSGNSTPNKLIQRVGDYYNIDGISNRYQMSSACSSSSYAIATAVDLIRLGDVRVVLAGGVDEVTPSVVEAFDACRIYSDMCRPFDVNRKGVVLGEAAAFFLLSDEQTAREHRLAPHGFIDGIGLTCDAHDAVSTWDVGISSAIVAALNDAKYSTVNFICAHGTGTKDNDATESRVITNIFGPLPPPVSSYKGALGHPQGASGAVGLALVLQVMKSHMIFGTVGLETLDENITLNVSNVPSAAIVDTAIVLSYGSWGTNSAIVVTR